MHRASSAGIRTKGHQPVSSTFGDRYNIQVEDSLRAIPQTVSRNAFMSSQDGAPRPSSQLLLSSRSQLLSSDVPGFSLRFRCSILLELLSLESPRLRTLSPTRLALGDADLLPAELFPCLLRRLREPEELEESVELSESESEEDSLSLSLEEESDPDLQDVLSCLAL